MVHVYRTCPVVGACCLHVDGIAEIPFFATENGIPRRGNRGVTRLA